MEIEEKIDRMIVISKNTIFLLKKKMNQVYTKKEYDELKFLVYENQSNIALLSEIVLNMEQLKGFYTVDEIKRFFENVKNCIKTSQSYL